MRQQHYDKARSSRYPWRAWYSTPQWKAIRAEQLRREPQCRLCAAAGVTTPAAIVDHIERHRGDRVRFFRGPFQSLCKLCHDGAKQRAERLGYSTEIGPDGLPKDPRHPFNS